MALLALVSLLVSIFAITSPVLADEEGPVTPPTPLAVVTRHEDGDESRNQASYWGANCTKPEGLGAGMASYQLPVLADGMVYDQVIVKAESGTYANTVFDNPAAGSYVWADTNGDKIFNVGGRGGDANISHIIICTSAAVVVSPAVTVTPPTCEADGFFTTTVITGVTYNVPTWTFGTPFTITTTLAHGYVLAEGNTGSFTITVLGKLTGQQCADDIAVTPAVTVTPPSCEANGAFTTTAIEGVTYNVPAEWAFGTPFTITTTLADRYVLAEGAQGSFTITVLAKLTGQQCQQPLVPTLVIDKVADTETITITGSAGSFVANPSVVTWTLSYTLTNGPVTGAVITDPVPAGFTFLDASNGGTLVGNTVTWNLGTLSASGSVTFRTTVNAETVARGTVTNTATIDSNETASDTGQDSVLISQSGTLGGNPTPTPSTSASAAPVRSGTLTSTGVPNTATSADTGVAALAVLGALMLLSAGVFVSATMGASRRRR